MAPEIYGWIHLFDRSHIHLSNSPTEPPMMMSTDCALKAIYYDENATKVIRGLIGELPKKEK
jgi:hypothetical protein